jgi:NAD(P)-dependent dehydrogenase (short-subunit alcohol dehydrogenase family)
MTAVVLITGANRGLGFEFARQYSAEGWRIFAACRNPDAASKHRRLVQETGGMLNESAAIDLAPRGITCVLANPGWVRTDMGGPKAPLSPQESVTAMRRLIDTFGPNQSGKFYNYDGREYPW